MNLLTPLLAVLSVFIDRLVLTFACAHSQPIDSIVRIYYMNIGYFLTSNGYYYMIKRDDVSDEKISEFKLDGKVPKPLEECDTAVLFDMNGCENEEDEHHSIACIEHLADGLHYKLFNISAYRNGDKRVWSELKSVKNDFLLSRFDIDFSQRIDASFDLDDHGIIYVIQGEHYAGIDFSESCPKNTDDVNVHSRRPLSELKVFGKIDAAYYDPDDSALYLLQNEEKQYYKVVIDLTNSENGKLVSLGTSKHDIAAHRIFSKICAPNEMHNSSQVIAEHSSINIMSNDSVTAQFEINVLIQTLLCVAFYHFIVK